MKIIDDKTVEIKTANGTLVIWESVFPYPGVSITFRPERSKQEIDIAYIEDVPDEAESPATPAKTVTCAVWANPGQEDYTEKHKIPVKDILNAVDDWYAVCPRCHGEFSIYDWNMATEKSFGKNITPLVYEDFVEKDTAAGVCEFKCPMCGEEVKGSEIIETTKRRETAQT